MADHRQVEVYNPVYDHMTEIDEGIVDLIQLLWNLGLETINSCQENTPGIMWISLPSDAAERFLTVMASRREEELEDPSSSLYCRMMECE